MVENERSGKGVRHILNTYDEVELNAHLLKKFAPRYVQL